MENEALGVLHARRMRMKVVDMHCDTIAEIYYAQSRGEDAGI